MKKHLLFAMAGAAALTLASCSADEPIAENTTQGAIRYNVVADNNSRAVASFDNVAKPTKFYMSAVWSTDSRPELELYGNKFCYFLLDEIAGDGNGTYTDVTGERYWPTDGTLSFYAAADGGDEPINIGYLDSEGNSFIYDNCEIAQIDYSVNADVAQQGDLIYAVQPNVSKPDDGMVNINFHHALSQVGFKAKNENPNVIITINSITVNDVKFKGTYILPTETTDKNDNRGSWELEERFRNFTETFTYGNQMNGEKTLDLAASDFKRVMALMPQKKEDFTFTLNLTVEGKDALQYPVDINVTNKDFEIPVSIDWEEGNRYIYTFTFGKNWKADGATPIGYTWTVDNWVDGNEANPDNNYDFYEGLPVLKKIGEHDAVLMRPAVDDNTPALYFATCNIGAATPAETGTYFWWGDTNGSVSSEDYDAAETFGKTLSELGDYLNGEGVLAAGKDAAAQLWGDTWRMPTKAELEWLKNECTWTWQAALGDKLAGFKVTSNYTGGEIFIPASGSYNYFYADGLVNKGSYVGCWSSTPAGVPESAFSLSAYSFTKSVGAQFRCYGLPVRPVAE